MRRGNVYFYNMTTRQRNFIVGLMVIALTGLIAFQVYWINNALALSETQFERNVQESLVQIADRLEEQEAVQLAQNTFVYFSKDGSTYQNSTIQLRRKPATGISVSADSDTKVISSDKNDESRFAYTIQSDSVIFIGPATGEESKQRIRNRVELLDVAVHRIFTAEQKDIKKRIQTDHLDSLLHATFSEKGIGTTYKYGIIETGSSGKDELVLTDASGQSAKVLDSRYRASLFPNDIDGPGHFLAVYFPNQSAYILREIGMTLIASLVFIGIILGSFIYTMKVIGRQKKLSDIKTDFINNMTHELKTPIATISLATQVLSEKDIGNDQESRNKYLRVIRDENDRLAQQVERVLQSSLMENNELALKMERESMHVLLSGVLATFKTMNGDCLISGKLEAAEDTIIMDVHHMQNVINNLLDNARKYSSAGCSIKVRTWNEENSLKISVTDNGIGMEARQLQHIFDSFYRIPTGNLHDVKGFGLGLSYVKRIVDLHNGTVVVKSSPGKGSEFTIILPYGE